MQLLGFQKVRSKGKLIQRADDSQVLGGQKNHNSSGRSPNGRESSAHWESEDDLDRVKNRMTSMKARKGTEGHWQQVTAQKALKTRQTAWDEWESTAITMLQLLKTEKEQSSLLESFPGRRKEAEEKGVTLSDTDSQDRNFRQCQEIISL